MPCGMLSDKWLRLTMIDINPNTNPKTSKAMKESLLSKLQKLDNGYLRKNWVTTESVTFEDYKAVKPVLSKVNDNPFVVSKPRKDGKGDFLKVVFPLDGGELEYDLSYNKDNCALDEGDALKLDTVKFCVEEALGEEHLYVTGELL